MATRTYLFTAEETAQLERLMALGFKRQDHFEDTDEPQVLFRHEQDGVDFTFYPEREYDRGDNTCWRVETHRQTNGRFAYGTCDSLITMTELNTLVNPAHWSDMLSTLKSLTCLADWNQIMRPRLALAVQSLSLTR